MFDRLLTLALVLGYVAPWALYLSEVRHSRRVLRLFGEQIDELVTLIEELDGEDPDPDDPDEDEPEPVADNVVAISRRAA